jgi:hypothetical protein
MQVPATALHCMFVGNLADLGAGCCIGIHFVQVVQHLFSCSHACEVIMCVEVPPTVEMLCQPSCAPRHWLPYVRLMQPAPEAGRPACWGGPTAGVQGVHVHAVEAGATGVALGLGQPRVVAA